MEGRSISLWLDEALSVGISSHPLTAIPGLLVQDGSPPLYYLLLHGWMELFGRSETAVRSLSLIFAVTTVPVAFWAGRSLWGRREGWLAALLAATVPYLTTFAQEARMYTLLALLALLTVVTFLHAFVFGRRRWLPGFVASMTLILYTHNWGLFLGAGIGLATVATAVMARETERRRVLVDAALAFGATAALYLPWVPTLVSQARRTAAPWSQEPALREAVSALGSILGDERALVALVVAAGVPMVALGRRWGEAEGRSAVALTVVLGGSLALAWLASQLQLGWSPRYFGIFLAPLLLIAALSLTRAGATGALATVLVVVLWTQPLGRLTGLRETPADVEKSNVRQVASALRPLVAPGDVIVSTQMEQIPVLRYYFGPEPTYATPMGPVADPTVVDWRDAFDRMRRATPAAGLEPLVGGLPGGRRLFLACPRTSNAPNDPRWDELMHLHCRSWKGALDGDPRMSLLAQGFPPPPDSDPGTSVYVQVYEKQA